MKILNLIKKQANLGLIILILLVYARSKNPKTVSIFALTDVPQLQFAIDELTAIFKEKGTTVNLVDSTIADIVIGIFPTKNLKSEGFQLVQKNGRIQIVGADAARAMYGGLELAEQIKISGLKGVKETTQNPFWTNRVVYVDWVKITDWVAQDIEIAKAD